MIRCDRRTSEADTWDGLGYYSTTTRSPFRRTGIYGTCQEILNTYHAVGILEHWDLSMKLFDATIKSPIVRWADHVSKINAGRWSHVRQELLRWAHKSEEILGVVKADLLLYEHGLTLFKRQTTESLGMIWLGIEP